MGQTQSEASSASASAATSVVDQTNPQSPDSLESILAEATAYGDNESESLDEKAQKALECPCVAGLRSGPCGSQFTESFLCFLKSTAEEKGSDCVNPFVALQACIKANPNAFSKEDISEDDNESKEEPTEAYKIIPPEWAKEKKPKL